MLRWPGSSASGGSAGRSPARPAAAGTTARFISPARHRAASCCQSRSMQCWISGTSYKCEKREKSSGRVKLALLSQISLAISPDAIRHSPLPDVQPDSLRCQQSGHDHGDKTMLNMIAVVGQGDGLQPCGFVAARWSGMVPARKQAVRREPVCLVLLFRMVDKIGRRQHVADPLADSRVCPTVGAAVKEEIVAALLRAALHGLFSGGGAFKRQPAAQVFIEIRQYPRSLRRSAPDSQSSHRMRGFSAGCCYCGRRSRARCQSAGWQNCSVIPTRRAKSSTAHSPEAEATCPAAPARYPASGRGEWMREICE